MKNSSRSINVLGIQRLTQADAARLEAIDPSIHFVDACGWFDGEVRETWEPYASARYLAPDSHGSGTREERDQLLSEAEVIFGGWPYPLDLRARSPKLKWFHLRNAGASNLLAGDLWDSGVQVTTARGLGNTGPMAEYVLAGILHFARGLHRAEVDRGAQTFNHRAYQPVSVTGKTVCIVGAGGIGTEVAKLCSAIGMHVTGTRSAPPSGGAAPPFDEFGGPGDLDRFLASSDFVAICCQWTPETTRLFNTARFAAMKQGAVLINVARGEIIDEDALFQALNKNQLRGVMLDVYDGEFVHSPPKQLWTDPRVVITPHVSAGTDIRNNGPVDIFCRNLRAYVRGEPLENVLDWERGY